MCHGDGSSDTFLTVSRFTPIKIAIFLFDKFDPFVNCRIKSSFCLLCSLLFNSSFFKFLRRIIGTNTYLPTLLLVLLYPYILAQSSWEGQIDDNKENSCPYYYYPIYFLLYYITKVNQILFLLPELWVSILSPIE